MNAKTKKYMGSSLYLKKAAFIELLVLGKAGFFFVRRTLASFRPNNTQ
jgi:hypothetical protein